MSNPSTFLREKQEDGGTREEQETLVVPNKTCMRRAMLFHATTPLDLSVVVIIVFCYCDCCHDGSVRDLTLVVVVKWVLLDSL